MQEFSTSWLAKKNSKKLFNLRFYNRLMKEELDKKTQMTESWRKIQKKAPCCKEVTRQIILYQNLGAKFLNYL